MELISKEEAMKAIRAIKEVMLTNGEVINALYHVPTIESRPKGEWIKNEYGWYYHCSVCKENNLLHTDEANALSDYCPHCGADMRGEEE